MAIDSGCIGNLPIDCICQLDGDVGNERVLF